MISCPFWAARLAILSATCASPSSSAKSPSMPGLVPRQAFGQMGEEPLGEVALARFV
jgi:hypothetical protein